MENPQFQNEIVPKHLPSCQLTCLHDLWESSWPSSADMAFEWVTWLWGSTMISGGKWEFLFRRRCWRVNISRSHETRRPANLSNTPRQGAYGLDTNDQHSFHMSTIWSVDLHTISDKMRQCICTYNSSKRGCSTPELHYYDNNCLIRCIAVFVLSLTSKLTSSPIVANLGK